MSFKTKPGPTIKHSTGSAININTELVAKLLLKVFVALFAECCTTFAGSQARLPAGGPNVAFSQLVPGEFFKIYYSDTRKFPLSDVNSISYHRV